LLKHNLQGGLPILEDLYEIPVRFRRAQALQRFVVRFALPLAAHDEIAGSRENLPHHSGRGTLWQFAERQHLRFRGMVPYPCRLNREHVRREVYIEIVVILERFGFGYLGVQACQEAEILEHFRFLQQPQAEEIIDCLFQQPQAAINRPASRVQLFAR
jgi:hypothetical protein